jgi:hypothetical protein
MENAADWLPAPMPKPAPSSSAAAAFSIICLCLLVSAGCADGAARRFFGGGLAASAFFSDGSSDSGEGGCEGGCAPMPSTGLCTSVSSSLAATKVQISL